METTNQTDEKKARVIIAEVDTLFHTAEKHSPDGSVTYLDVLRICNRVREHFEKVPSRIEGALEVAAGLCNPSKLESIDSMRKGFGAIIASAGGLGLLVGIVTIIGHGLIATTVTGMLFWKTSIITILWGGPIGIALGVLGIATGFYFLAKQVSAKQKAIIALDVIKKAITEWGSFGSISTLPDIAWAKKLTDDEFTSLLSLMWYITNVDHDVDEAEVRLIEHVLKSRKIKSAKFLMTGAQPDIDTSLDILSKSRQKKECALLIKAVINADNKVTPEEESAWDQIVSKLEI